MADQIVDARGLACPQPVVNTKKVLDTMTEGTITTIVDNEAAKENVVTLVKGMGCEYSVEERNGEYYIKITKKGGCIVSGETKAANTVILFGSSEMGRGSAELGAVLMKSFVFTLVENEELPGSMLFFNSGVHLTCEGSPVLEHLATLEKRGVEILSCGTCLDYYKLKEKLSVGQVTNMYTILEKMNKAAKVITL